MRIRVMIISMSVNIARELFSEFELSPSRKAQLDYMHARMLYSNGRCELHMWVISGGLSSGNYGNCYRYRGINILPTTYSCILLSKSLCAYTCVLLTLRYKAKVLHPVTSVSKYLLKTTVSWIRTDHEHEGIPYARKLGLFGGSRSGFVPSELSLHFHTTIIHARPLTPRIMILEQLQYRPALYTFTRPPKSKARGAKSSGGSD